MFRGPCTNLQLAALKHSTAFDARAAAKHGRDQASSKGKVTSQGQTSDKQLSTEATAKMHGLASLLLARDSNAASGHTFLSFPEQNPEAVDIIKRLTAAVNRTGITVAEEALKRSSLQQSSVDVHIEFVHILPSVGLLIGLLLQVLSQSSAVKKKLSKVANEAEGDTAQQQLLWNQSKTLKKAKQDWQSHYDEIGADNKASAAKVMGRNLHSRSVVLLCMHLCVECVWTGMLA